MLNPFFLTISPHDLCICCVVRYKSLLQFAHSYDYIHSFDIEHAKNVSTTHCSCSMQKQNSKKQLIFEKYDHFENCHKWQPSKGHSLCKIVTLAQKLKRQKKHAKNVSTTHCSYFIKKNGSKKQLIFEK